MSVSCLPLGLKRTLAGMPLFTDAILFPPAMRLLFTPPPLYLTCGMHDHLTWGVPHYVGLFSCLSVSHGPPYAVRPVPARSPFPFHSPLPRLPLLPVIGPWRKCGASAHIYTLLGPMAARWPWQVCDSATLHGEACGAACPPPTTPHTPKGAV
eukprot:EG_transcript_18810